MPIIRRRGGPDRTKVPAPLIVVEALLSLALVRYMVNFMLAIYVRTSSDVDLALRSFSMLFSLVMALMIVNTAIGIGSARPGSWRKSVRTALILLLSNRIYELLYSLGLPSDGVTFDEMFISLASISAIAVLFLPSSRRFYLPVMMENPPLIHWIGYVFAWPLFPATDYAFVRKSDGSGRAFRRSSSSCTEQQLPRRLLRPPCRRT